MGRIEDAIHRIQAGAASRKPGTNRDARQSESPKRIASIDATGVLPIHDYGGKTILFDIDALRENGLLAPDVQSRALEDQYRAIKRPILDNANPQRDPDIPHGNIVVVASALSGEGKTFSCVNFCLSIAREKDWSVLLIDGDCSKPHLTRLFSAEHEKGLLDLLSEESLDAESVIMPTDLDGLSFLPTGTQNQNAAELLASRKMSKLCSAMSQSDPHRMIVFDSPPQLLTSEAPVLASHAGQILVIVKANSTPQQAVLTALEKLNLEKPIGLVLNQQVRQIESITGDYYGYGYGYADAS